MHQYGVKRSQHFLLWTFLYFSVLAIMYSYYIYINNQVFSIIIMVYFYQVSSWNIFILSVQQVYIIITKSCKSTSNRDFVRIYHAVFAWWILIGKLGHSEVGEAIVLFRVERRCLRLVIHVFSFS